LQAGGHRFDSDILHGTRGLKEGERILVETQDFASVHNEEINQKGGSKILVERITAIGLGDWIYTSLIINHSPLTIIDDVDPGDRVER